MKKKRKNRSKRKQKLSRKRKKGIVSRRKLKRKSMIKKLKRRSPKKYKKKYKRIKKYYKGVRGLRKLISIGKEKGCLTYEEVNNLLPEDVVSSEQIDEVLSILDQENIQVLDSEEVGELEAKVEKKEGKESLLPPEEVYLRPLQIDDPVKMYLRQMGQIPLLSHQEEIELAKKIKFAEAEFREAVLKSSIAKREVLNLANDILEGRINFDDVLDWEMKVERNTKRHLNKLVSNLKKARGKEKILKILFDFNLSISVIENISSKIRHSLQELEKPKKR